MDQIEHCLARPGMYLGNTNSVTHEVWLHKDGKMVSEECTYNPALLKMFDEIVTNSVDEYKRNGSVTEIKISTSSLTGEIEISDNGGIPVKIHPEYGTYVPAMLFGELLTGSNFNDEEGRITGGTHGMGSVLVNIFSSYFKVQTADGNKIFTQEFRDNLSKKDEPVIKNSASKGTTITFIPDYHRLGCELDYDNLLRIEKRVYDIAGCNPNIKVYFNNQLIRVNKFRDYVLLYVNSFVEDTADQWDIAVSSSDNGFRQVSFVNGVDTFNGGTHVEYVVNQITNKIRDFIKKKHKIDVRPANIKQHLFLFINCTINAPIFTSQTKEFMSSDVKHFGSTFSVTDKFIKKLLDSDIVTKVLDWVEGEKRRNELAELRKLNKTTQNNNFLKKIVKFDDASSKNRKECIIILTEGDSAAASILSARDAKTMGVFPLKGKPINVRDIDIKKLVNNEEFSNIMAIVGLKIGHKVESLDDLRFGKMYVASDQDGDGIHIYSLIINMFVEFWPELIELGFINRLSTPLIIADGKEFFSVGEFNKYKENNKVKTSKYFKGLGSFSAKEFKKFLTNDSYVKKLTVLDQEDFDALNVAFDKSKADERKEWLIS